MDIAVRSYEVSRLLPREETFGLVTQIRRSAASVPANVAEGHGRESTLSFVQFLRVAQGSLKELETHLLLAQRLNLLPGIEVGHLCRHCDELGRMIRALIRSLQRRASRHDD